MGFVNTDTVQRTELLMEEMGVGTRDRVVVRPAADAARRAGRRARQRRHLLRAAIDWPTAGS